MNSWERPVSFILLFLLILATVIHGLSIIGINVQQIFPPVFAMHLLAMLGFLAAFIKLMSGLGFSTDREQSRRDPLKMYRWIFQNSSMGFLVLFLLLLLYAVVNFMLFTSNMEGGGPGIIEGNWVLHNHGEIIREITYEEYNWFQSQELRGFSGLWMAFLSFGLALTWPVRSI